MFNDATRKWLAEQRVARRRRMHEEATAKKESNWALEREAGLAGPSKDPRDHVLNQDRVDKIRARVQYTVAFEALKRDKNLEEEPRYHIWFPENDDRKYELRHGNPPADVDRPKHLKGMKLAIDLSTLTEIQVLKIREVVKAKQKRRYKGQSSSQILRGNRALMEHLARKAGLARG